MIELPRELEKTFAEFFAGVGLMRLGLERAGWKIEHGICAEKFDSRGR